MAGETTRIIRPAAFLREIEARRILEVLTELDVGQGGVWNASPGIWQRYDKPWDGPAGLAGTAALVGTIGVTYGAPTRYEMTIYRVTVTRHGLDIGWTVESLCDDALAHVGLTLAECPRAELKDPPIADPFKR